jgi:hypothetical protein
MSVKGAEEGVGKPNGSSHMPKAIATTPAENILPVPVQQGARSESSKRKQKKNARIGGGVRVYWSKFTKHLGTGTAPSTTSMIGDGSAVDSFHTRATTTETDEEKDEVDEVVVDRIWSEKIRSSDALSDAEVAAENPEQPSYLPRETSEHESLKNYEGFWALASPLVFIRWKLWPRVMEFFSCRFFDPKAEDRYQRENWFVRKVGKLVREKLLSLLINTTACRFVVFCVLHC